MTLNWILPYEESLFFLINGSQSYLLDCMMWIFSGIKIWIPIAVFLVFNIVYNKSWKQWLLVLLSITLVFTLCDQFSSHFMKPLFERPRPTHYPLIMEHVKTLYGYTGGKYGFISGHAANSFGFAMFTALLFKNKYYGLVIFAWATIVAYSRIYLGVHFVSDIIGGMIAGIVIGFIVYKLYMLATKKIQQKPDLKLEVAYPNKQINIMSSVMALYILFFTVSSQYLINFLK